MVNIYVNSYKIIYIFITCIYYIIHIYIYISTIIYIYSLFIYAQAII